MPRYVLFVIFFLTTIGLKAQTWEIGAAAGAAGYLGDLNLNNPLKVSGVAVGGFIKRNFSGYLSLKFNYTFGTIAGADSTSHDLQQRERNLSFATKLNEFALISEFNFFHYIPQAGRNKFTPYIYLGVGAINYNPTAVYTGTRYSLRQLTTEGEKKPYPTVAVAFPYGAGVKYNIAGKLTLAADIGYRNPSTDYLDDVSGYYPDKSKLSSPVAVALSDRSGERTGIYTGSAGSQRGDLAPHDTYFFTQISISYTFVTQKCYFER